MQATQRHFRRCESRWTFSLVANLEKAMSNTIISPVTGVFCEPFSAADAIRRLTESGCRSRNRSSRSAERATAKSHLVSSEPGAATSPRGVLQRVPLGGCCPGNGADSAILRLQQAEDCPGGIETTRGYTAA